MSNAFFEEITGLAPTNTADFEVEIENLKKSIRNAKRAKCHGIEIVKLSNRARAWLEESPFEVERVEEIFVYCCNNDEFNKCDCYACRHVDEKTGEKKWRISWPKTPKK